MAKSIRRAPVWKGPEVDGITFSLLSRFLVCRERFRIRVVQGLRAADAFNHRLHYGQMWHVCEEYLAQDQEWEGALATYCRDLCKKYPTSQEQISHWYEVCRAQFPLYVKYWHDHPDVTSRTPLFQEQVFCVPYKLPSGRTVLLRGKWDSVDLIGAKSPAIYLQENKTKGDIKEAQLKRQLTFDLQTMMYLTALQEEWAQGHPWSHVYSGAKIAGVRYNVVRRPLSGGKGTIVRHKSTKSNPMGESKSHFYGRVRDVIKEDPSHFFMRWKVEIHPEDIRRFRQRTLNPILEQLCDWWEVIYDYYFTDPRVLDTEPLELSSGAKVIPLSLHWQHPFGVYNILDEGGSDELDEYIATGSELGLERTDNLFPELTENVDS